MIRRPPGSTRTDTLFPYTTLVRSKLLALTPISPFRPRRWRGALLPDTASIELRVLEPSKRPVSAVADQHEVRDVASVRISADPATTLTLLFDPDHALDDRIAKIGRAHV